MSAFLYDDEQCTYCWGDPRSDQSFVSGRLILTAEAVRFESECEEIVWPKSAVRSIAYAPTHAVDLDQLARSYGAAAAADIEIGLNMDEVPDPALSLVVDDPEGVEPSGFDIRILFRSAYYAKVFGKRASVALGVPFTGFEG